ncbi:hypothetical protein LUZ63_018971 [Rhynchospora breviuscula]|uniref:Peptide N-acetyl-beta-D-glucosaminyl asparaginase amidase A N-terminal domain-containing protein n=1 Tax=Rhynchospora breviuscula TaxID=2022672 RepID=A0A9Q0HIE4_9POAL|nr:hypothetical protein LUZ63_018971 [Rhynchospora breviuscula]
MHDKHHIINLSPLPSTSPLFLLPLLFLGLIHFSNSHNHKLKFTTSEFTSSSSSSTSPTTYFEVTRPIPVPRKQPCSLLLLQHNFAYTYGQPPATSVYTPPSCLTQTPSLIVLEWNATCKGRQFDRIFGVWLGEVELLRVTGIVWTVQKDVTRHSLLFLQSSAFAVYLGNIVDSTYTGVYNVNVSVYFYFESNKQNQGKGQGYVPAFDSPADLILPISRSLPLNDGLWFFIQNSADIQSKEVTIPTKTYRAVVELYLSYHADYEFWYTNPPNDYISKNNLTGLPGNGAFREVRLTIDANVVGAVWPFTVIYTGGVNPLLWRPITGIGSFNLPSYDIEITPFLGNLLDGKSHTYGFGVTNGLELDVWFVDANLHLWLDQKSNTTTGNLINYDAPEFEPNTVSIFSGLDGTLTTNADRHISASSWVESSYGNITSHFSQDLHFLNFMEFSDNGNTQQVKQTIEATYNTYAETPHTVVYTEQLQQNFPLFLYTGVADVVGNNYSLVSNVSLGFNEKWINREKHSFGFVSGSLTNLQNAQGEMKVQGNWVTSGIGSAQQVYKYEGTDGCYFRQVSSSNYTILSDKSVDSSTGESCEK